MATGFFGKMPAHGDFVARGLPAGARPVLDHWLTRVLAPLARQPDNWPEGGFRAVIAHGDAVLALLILPSRDRSARAFPLAAVAVADAAGQAQVDAWADQVLPALCLAGQGRIDAEKLIERLGRFTLPADKVTLAPPLIWIMGQSPQDPAALLQQIVSSG